MTTPAPTVRLHCVLNLYVRTRGARPGTSNEDLRRYTKDLHGVDPTVPDYATLHEIYEYTAPGVVTQTTTTLVPAAVHVKSPTLHVAVFVESYPASDKFVKRVEAFGWRRTEGGAA